MMAGVYKLNCETNERETLHTGLSVKDADEIARKAKDTGWDITLSLNESTAGNMLDWYYKFVGAGQ